MGPVCRAAGRAETGQRGDQVRASGALSPSKGRKGNTARALKETGHRKSLSKVFAPGSVNRAEGAQLSSLAPSPPTSCLPGAHPPATALSSLLPNPQAKAYLESPPSSSGQSDFHSFRPMAFTLLSLILSPSCLPASSRPSLRGTQRIWYSHCHSSDAWAGTGPPAPEASLVGNGDKGHALSRASV